MGRVRQMRSLILKEPDVGLLRKQTYKENEISIIIYSKSNAIRSENIIAYFLHFIPYLYVTGKLLSEEATLSIR